MKQTGEKITIYRTEKLSGAITAPASKSYAQRAVAIAALAKGISRITNMTLCNDTNAALEVIRTMGAEIRIIDGVYEIKGGVSPHRDMVLNIGEAGLSARLFTPIAALFDCTTTITGEGSILSRPLGNVTEPLEALGAHARTSNGMLPIEIKGGMRGGEITIDGSLGSQFLTGLLIALPMAPEHSVINVTELRSIPYIDMTINIMRHFGIEAEHMDYTKFKIKGGQHYAPATYNVEGDWSGASCLLVAGAIAGDTEKGVQINNLNTHSSQADKAILKALENAGAKMKIEDDSVTVYGSDLHGFTFDATHCPDLFPALVILAAAAKGETTLIGTGRLTHKESDRATVLRDIYRQMGIDIDISQNDIMTVKGGRIKGGASIDSHNDHRIAMSIATAALIADAPITITTAKAVDKSYCGFYTDLKTLQHNE